MLKKIFYSALLQTVTLNQQDRREAVRSTHDTALIIELNHGLWLNCILLVLSEILLQGVLTLLDFSQLWVIQSGYDFIVV